MTVQITIIGLGQIGTSIGLALAKYPERIRRVGYDRVLETQNKAKSLGALDAAMFNLPAAIESADVILLCIPFNEVQEVLKQIAPDLREGAVVMDFSPQKAAAQRWFEQLALPNRYYIGLVASTNPLFLEENETGIGAARADLFDKATFGIAAPTGTPAQVFQLADDLVKYLGATPMFMDMLEADGMLLSAHLLPQVLSAAFLNASVGQPGWSEAQRFAGRAFAQSSAALGTDTLGALAQALLQNPLGSLNALDGLIAALTYLRKAVQTGDTADLEQRLNLAYDDREHWRKARGRAEWDQQREKSSAPSGTDAIKRIFLGGGPGAKRQKK